MRRDKVKSSKFTLELEALAKRLGEDGYPNALIERAAERNQALEETMIEFNKQIEAICTKCKCTCNGSS